MNITLDIEKERELLQKQIQMHYDGMKACEGAIALIQLKVKEEAEKKAKELAEKQKPEVKK